MKFRSDTELKNAIDELDFSMIIHKMVLEKGWLVEEAQEAARLYRNFMFLSAKYPDKRLPPSEDVDEFWHNHILDTYRYAPDCEKIFGAYRHHYPYFGIDEKTNSDDLSEAFSETQQLHYEEFGEHIYDVRLPFRNLISLGRKLQRKFRQADQKLG